MLKPEQIAQLRNLIAEGNRLLKLGDKQAAASNQQCIEALNDGWRKLRCAAISTAMPLSLLNPQHFQVIHKLTSAHFEVIDCYQESG